MIKQRPCVNGILAAVLSASIVPMHGALAKEAKDSKPATAKHAMKKPAKATPGKADAEAPAATDAAPATSAAPAEGDGAAPAAK